MQRNSLARPGTQGTVFSYAATVDIENDASLGSASPCVLLTVAYECATQQPNPCTPTPPQGVLNHTGLLTVEGFPVSFSEIRSMSFGVLVLPTVATGVRAHTDGRFFVRSGSSQIITSGHTALFAFEAEPNTSIRITTDFVSADDPGLSLRRFRVSHGADLTRNPRNFIFTSNSNATTNDIIVGAQLEINPALATPGDKSLTYTIAIDYE